jgi:hypothetical protein
MFSLRIDIRCCIESRYFALNTCFVKKCNLLEVEPKAINTTLIYGAKDMEQLVALLYIN